MPFVNPTLLWLSALIAVPIIIYLINRQRYQRRKWAAMEFLLRALKRSQRRIQLQNLLLLLIRVAVLLLLALAVARPIARQTPLGAAAGGPQNWILVVDTTYSMGYRDGPRSHFEEARESLVEMVERLLKPDDRVTLMTMGYQPRVLVPKSEVKANRRDLLRELEVLKLTNRGMRLVPSLRLLEEVADSFTDSAGDPEPARVVFFSDLQRKDWLGGDGPRDPESREILTRLRDRGFDFSVGKVSTLDGARQVKLNAAVTDLSVNPRLVAADMPVEIQVTVHNFSDRDAENLDLSLRVEPPDQEEETEPQLGEVIRVEAGSSVTRTVAYRFDAPGYHTVEAEVRSDGLTVDNRRHLVVRVHEQVEVLLVDGDPAVEPLRRETVFLEYALEPTDDALGAGVARFTPFRPEYLGAEQLADVAWERYALVVLANVSEVPKRELESLERYVAEGGALMVFMGENVRPEYYNEYFHREGKGLLPWPLGEVRGSDSAPVYMRFTGERHPVAEFFAEHREMSYLYTGIVAFYYYIQAEQPDSPDGDSEGGGDGVSKPPLPGPVRVLCRYSDLDSSPAVFDNPFGRGHVMWFTSSADQDWNEFPIWHDFVVFLHESISYLVSLGERTDNLLVGDTFEQVYESDEYASEVLLRLPGGDEGSLGGDRVLRRAMRELRKDERFRITHEDTSVPGLYRLELKRPHSPSGDTVQYFAVNVETEESDLRGMVAEDFETHFAVEPTFFDVSATFREEARKKDLLRGYEFWPWVLGAVLLLLLLETVLAQVFGRGTR